jgi:hypothetical protein
MNEDALTPLLPTSSQTDFLRACLDDTARAGESWERWLRDAGRDGIPARRALTPVNAFLPLLAWNLWRHRVPLDRALETHLRAAQLTEELRLRKYRAICASLFEVLQRAGLPFVVVKGAALGDLVYPTPLLRHADDIDLLLHERDLETAVSALAASGWRHTPPPNIRNALHLPALVHPSGVTVELHWRLLIPYYTLPYERLWERSRPATVAGVEGRVLSEADNLLHVCAHGMAGFPIIRWVPDAWFMLQRWPGLDWSVFTSATVDGRLELPVSVALGYLAGRMNLPIPSGVLDDLRRRAVKTGYIGRQAARPWPEGRSDTLRVGAGSRWRRVTLNWRRLFPPPIQFALHYDVRLWTVPFYYLYRLTRHTRGLMTSGVRTTRSRRQTG